MGKFMNVLERYKLIEKQVEEIQTVTIKDEGEQEVVSGLSEEIKEEDVLGEIKTVENVVTTEVEERMESVLNQTKEEVGKTMVYDRRFSLEEIYNLKGLKMQPQTETVFVLENLIQALPAELPEYVKKQTVSNIIIASAMNLEKLIVDGEARQTCLQTFAEEYTSQTIQDIESLTAEIAKLSLVIKEYQDQIKNKERMLQEQSNLMKKEEQHLEQILEFFSQK